MSKKDWDYIPRADYDLDGEVDDFEMGMFLHEMEEEDRAISEGRAFFGTGKVSVDDDDDDDLFFGEDIDEEEDGPDLDLELDRDLELDSRLQSLESRVDDLITELTRIRDSEQSFLDEHSEAIYTERYSQAEDNVSYLDDAISGLEDAKFQISMAEI